MKRAPKGLREIERAVTPLGWTWERTTSNHVKWHGPKGEMVMTGSTSSDHRAVKNALRDFRQYGYPV